MEAPLEAALPISAATEDAPNFSVSQVNAPRPRIDLCLEDAHHRLMPPIPHNRFEDFSNFRLAEFKGVRSHGIYHDAGIGDVTMQS